MKCTVTRLDAQLTMEAPPRLRYASFERDARELLARMRSVNVEGALIAGEQRS